MLFSLVVCVFVPFCCVVVSCLSWSVYCVVLYVVGFVRCSFVLSVLVYAVVVCRFLLLSSVVLLCCWFILMSSVVVSP